MAGLAADGTLTEQYLGESAPTRVDTFATYRGQIDPATIPFLASGSSGLTDGQIGPGGAQYLTALTPVHGRIASSDFETDPTAGTTTRSQTIIGTSGGWNNFRTIIDDYDPNLIGTEQTWRWLFALHPNGRLYRYQYVFGTSGHPDRILAAGSVPGVGNVKTLALLARRHDYDLLVGTTTSGYLLTIQVGKATSFVTHTTYLRTGTWQGFDTLLANPCAQSRNGYTIVGVQNGSRRAFVYHVGALAGPSTIIRSRGSAGGVSPLKLTGLVPNLTP